ncbi:MAG TPA: tRNA pseudouridine(38-40) synthase TruA [Lacipirellulaceae bacterium]|jgi:tRNA pseudouridine38-40 synthase|nr:tRNA pseudouridine(38-40) synthase TruA [Lacipirellulaceae bacterium]
MPNRWLKLTVAYDGGAYSGWQFQPDKPTVQGTFEATWQSLTQESLRVTAAGRTDAGVHALGQVVGLVTSTRLTDEDLHRGLNALLPNDIAVVTVETAADNFHATYDAIGKRYRYQIHNARTPSVFSRHFAWHYPQPLDATAMHIAAQALTGRHDFSSFETAGSERPSSIRTIHELTVGEFLRNSQLEVSEKLPYVPNHIIIEVAGDGFLYNMVRTIVGTLVEVGVGKRDIDWPAEVLAAQDRRRAGQTAPPHGLFLVSVDY